MTPSPVFRPAAARRAVSLALCAALAFGFSGAPPVEAKAAKRPRTESKKAAKNEAKKEKPTRSEAQERASLPAATEAPEPPRIEYPRIPVDPSRPSEISIVPHFSPEDRRARQREETDRRLALAPRAEAWSRAFRTEGAPFARSLDEALRVLRTAIGRSSRNVCYPLQAATERLAATLPEAPDTRLEAEIRTALARVANGTRICLEGRTATAQTEIRGGAALLARAAETIVGWGR